MPTRSKKKMARKKNAVLKGRPREFPRKHFTPFIEELKRNRQRVPVEEVNRYKFAVGRFAPKHIPLTDEQKKEFRQDDILTVVDDGNAIVLVGSSASQRKRLSFWQRLPLIGKFFREGI